MSAADGLDRRLQRATRRAAEALITPAQTRPQGSPWRRWAVVTAVNAGPPASVDLDLDGTTVAGVRYLASYLLPMVNDTVIVDITNNDPVVLGPLA